MRCSYTEECRRLLARYKVRRQDFWVTAAASAETGTVLVWL